MPTTWTDWVQPPDAFNVDEFTFNGMLRAQSEDPGASEAVVKAGTAATWTHGNFPDTATESDFAVTPIVGGWRYTASLDFHWADLADVDLPQTTAGLTPPDGWTGNVEFEASVGVATEVRFHCRITSTAGVDPDLTPDSGLYKLDAAGVTTGSPGASDFEVTHWYTPTEITALTPFHHFAGPLDRASDSFTTDWVPVDGNELVLVLLAVDALQDTLDPPPPGGHGTTALVGTTSSSTPGQTLFIDVRYVPPRVRFQVDIPTGVYPLRQRQRADF